MGVTSGRLDLEDTVLDGEDRDIKGTTAKIEDEDVALGTDLLVKTVGNGGRSRLVDDAQDVETGNDTGVLGGLTLRVVEVSGHCDNSVLDRLAKVSLGGLLHLDEDHRGNLLRRKNLLLALVVNLDLGLAVLGNNREGPVLHVALHVRVVETTANQTLGVKDSVGRVHRDLQVNKKYKMVKTNEDTITQTPIHSSNASNASNASSHTHTHINIAHCFHLIAHE